MSHIIGILNHNFKRHLNKREQKMKMNNALQRMKVDYDRRLRQKLRDMIVILKDIRRKKRRKSHIRLKNP